MRTKTCLPRRGFTLVELLVVIGIIALLISILLPSLRKARDQANRTKCLSNQKQMMMAVIMYTNENKGIMPFCNWLSLEDDSSKPWYSTGGWLYRYGATGSPFDAQNKPKETRESGTLWPFLKVHDLYVCPTVLDAGYTSDAPSRSLASFLMNGAMCAYGNTAVFKITAFKPDAVVMWEVDESQGWWNDGSGFPTEGITKRHGNGGTVSCIDGHAEWMGRKDYRIEVEQNQMANPPKNRLWCDPDNKGPSPRGVMSGDDAYKY